MRASGGRRGCLLETAGAGREAGVLPRGHGLASLSQDCAGILETTDGLRQSRGYAREKVAGIVLFRPLSLEHSLGFAVAHLLFPICPHSPAIVMPDHGRGAEPQLPAPLPRSPANIHVVPRLPALRIKCI